MNIMKGIELPINVLVIIVVAFMVLLGIVALYYGGFTGPVGAMSSEGAKVKYCGVLMKNVFGCSTVDPAVDVTIDDYDADTDGTIDAGPGTGVCGVAAAQDNLQMLAICHYGVDPTAAAGEQKRQTRKICGCAA